MPQTVFTAKSLTALKLCQCKLKQQSSNDSIKLHSRRKLSLMWIDVDEQMFHHIISHCPLIENLCVVWCDGLSKLGLTVNLHNLKKVRISGLKEVEINAPSLQSFLYNIGEGDTFVLNIDSSCDLKVLHLEGLSIRDQLFKNLMSKFPLLEDIHLQYVSDLKRIDILSQSLEKIDLDNCNQLVEAKIGTPNLFSFEYVGNGIPSLYFFRAPHQLKATIICLKYDINPSWLLALRKFVADWNPSRV